MQIFQMYSSHCVSKWLADIHTKNCKQKWDTHWIACCDYTARLNAMRYEYTDVESSMTEVLVGHL